LPILFSDKWDAEKDGWRDPLDLPSMNSAVSLIDRDERSTDDDPWFVT